MSHDADMDSTARQLICPVCNVLLQKEDVVATIDHGKHVHSFCSEACKAEFEKDPKNYH
jgi:YHS domain-containing protein